MRKFAAILLSLILAAGIFTACGSKSSTEKTSSSNSDDTAYEIAMLIDTGTIEDGTFKQSVWEGIKEFADANGKTYRYYQPKADTTKAYMAKIDEAVSKGAEVVIAMGTNYSDAVAQAQKKYKNVHFISFEGKLPDGVADNTVTVEFKNQEAGYLAGYAMVKNGYTELGFIGGKKYPSILGYGFGYIQGANDAAKEENETVTIRYKYSGTFVASDEVEKVAGDWFVEGTQVIFACSGGTMTESVTAAAETYGGSVVGVDVDQSQLSNTVVTSAMKDLKGTVKKLLTEEYGNVFPGGQSLVLGAADDAVGLPATTSRFEAFSDDDYNNLYTKLKNGEITVVTSDAAKGPVALVKKMGYKNVKILYYN